MKYRYNRFEIEIQKRDVIQMKKRFKKKLDTIVKINEKELKEKMG